MSGNNKKRFGLLKLLVIAVALLAVSILAIPFIMDANQFRPTLESRLAGALGRECKVGNLRLSLLSGSIAADDIAIADDPQFSRSPFVLAKSLQVGVKMQPLIFSRAVHITGITLEQPDITLIRSASGQWNFSSLGAKSGQSADVKPGSAADASRSNVEVALLRVVDGRMTVIRSSRQNKPSVYDKVNITVRDLAAASVFPFTLAAALPGGGSVRLDGKAGPLNGVDALLTPVTAALAVSRFDLIASGFLEPDSGLAGLLDFEGSITSDGNQVQSQGHATADRLQVVRTGSPAGRQIALDYRITHRLQKESGTLDEATVAAGKAIARLNGTYDIRGDTIYLKLRLRGEKMPAADLEALLPAIGATLPKGASLQGGTLNADFVSEGPIGRGVTTGTVGLFNARLTGFDLSSKMATVASLAGIKPDPVTEIETFSSGMRLTPEGIEVSGLSLIVPTLGQLSGDGRVGASHALDFRMLGRLKTSGGIAGGLARLTGGKDGILTVPFFIRGTTSDPRFIPDAKGVAAGLLESAASGKDAQTGEPSAGKSLADTVRGLFGKKKK